MIDDIKDLTSTEKTKKMLRRKFFVSLGKCTPVAVVAVAVMSLFSIFMAGDFLGAFTNENAYSTTGRFLTLAFLFLALFAASYTYTDKGKFAARNYILVTVTIVLDYVACLSTARFLNVYAMPIALVTLVLIELTDRRTAVVGTAVTAMMLLMSYYFTNQLKFDNFTIDSVIASVLCNSVGAVAISFLVDKHFTRLKFLLASMGAALVSVPFVVVSTVAAGDVSWNILLNAAWSYGASLAAIAVFMPLVALFEGIFNIADDFKLNELTNLNHPLLKRLASEAPGTFNHSLVVGNLAEACADAIGENPLLAKAAAYYHDVGKLKAPIYFSENQSTYNPHDELIPEVSVSMITSHTVFGEILAKQYRLPPEIVAICRGHHGTAPVGYFYRKALSLTEEGDLSTAKYAYSGPKPQTKVAAIVMITDTVEAACRAYMPETKEEFVAKINSLVEEKLKLGQFDECPITMNDLNVIKTTIIEVLPGIHHSRVSYDKKK